MLTVGVLAGSHRGRGWEEFTDRAIDLLSKNKEDLVFLLWGKQAQKKAELVCQTKHLVLCADHPRTHTFALTCNHFSQTKSLVNW